jgi:hypothetical protein
MSRQFNFYQDTEYHRIDKNSSVRSPNAIDKMLASQLTSTNVSPLPSPLASPLLRPMHSITETANAKKRGHRAQSKSMSSVTRLRSSSMDLLKTLKEAEERERQRALEGLLSKARQSLSEDRKMSGEISIRTAVTERAKAANEEYEMPGMLGHPHQTWPGAIRGSSSGVTAN